MTTESSIYPVEPLQASVNASGIRRVVVFTTEGKLTFDGDLKVSVQDGRNHKSTEHFRIRFLFSESHGTIRDSRIDMTIRYEPYTCVPVNMSKQANVGFRDDVDGDGKGGWTDQGENDIRMLKPGTIKICGLSFRVLDPKRNSGKSCLVFCGPRREHLLKSAELSAPSRAARMSVPAARRGIDAEDQRPGRNGSRRIHGRLAD